MSDKLNKYFKDHRLLYYFLNLLLIGSLLKLFQINSYPDADFSAVLTAGNIEFLL